MKKNFLLFAIALLATTCVFNSCKEDEENFNDEGSKVSLPDERIFILNEGSYDGNNSCIDFYAPNNDLNSENKSFISNFNFTQNDIKLGDTGQDIIVYENNIFVSVFGSSLLVKYNSALVEQGRVQFSEQDGQPRYLTAKDNKIYVTLYSGKIAKIDAKTLIIEDYITVGKNPEEITQDANNLYVVNSGWGADSTISVVSIKDFSTIKTINVENNPFSVKYSNGKLFVLSYGKFYDYPLQMVDIYNNTVETIGNGVKIAENDGILYVVQSITDWATNKVENNFYSYNVQNNQKIEQSFIDISDCEEIASNSIYMFEINPKNGDFYISTSDFVTNGIVYRFNKNGKLITKFTSGGINPSHAVFIY
ncbi:MAG: hypothetical protein MJ211_00665 [Bacteroidales bacterium]|nr:hypothetical protein [Bacteroidales bacterium]